ncbi:hypothetical protein Ancab_003519 [Ancistrocladus abbreviatus]
MGKRERVELWHLKPVRVGLTGKKPRTKRESPMICSRIAERVQMDAGAMSDYRELTSIERLNMIVANVSVLKSETSYSSLVMDIRRLLRKEWVVKISHIHREANSCADWAANSAASMSIGKKFLQSAPESILR